MKNNREALYGSFYFDCSPPKFMKKFDRQNPHFWQFRYINVHFWPRESIRRGRFTPLQCSFNFFDLLKVDFKQFSTFWPTFDLQNRRFFSSIAILEAFRTIFHLPCHRSLSLCYKSLSLQHRPRPPFLKTSISYVFSIYFNFSCISSL